MLPPLTSNVYSKYNQRICDMTYKVAEENMCAASAHLHRVPLDDMLDIAVTCDGMWSKRGFTATHGIVVVINSWDTGQVLDFEVLTKLCIVCAQRDQAMSSEDFQRWMEKHTPECIANHSGSSNSMEKAGAAAVFKR